MSLTFTKHPLWPIPKPDEIQAMADAGVLERYYNEREEQIRLEKEDPYRFGADYHRPGLETVFAHWKDADEALSDPGVDIVYIFGGNRAGKSRYVANRVVKRMVMHKDYRIWCCHSSADSSIQVQQPYIYEYLPLTWKEQKRTVRSVLNIGFTQKNGFSNRTFVGPNRSQCWFKNYTQDIGTLEGTELDLIWMDELVPFNWVETLKYRLVTRKGKMVITFTPIDGYTQVVGDAMTGMTITQTREAELMTGPATIPGCPKGHMPYEATTRSGRGKIYWFFSEWNPFSPFSQMKRALKGRTREELEIRAYGYVSNPIVGKFPRFTKDNIVEPEQIPKEGTNYMVVDPTSGDRNWTIIWARVDDLGRIFVYREWPDYENYGEWALPSSKADGKPGPAQTADCGRNLHQYRQLIRALEKTDGGMHDRFIDPRSGRTAVLSQREHNQSLIDMLAEPERGAGGEVIRDGLFFSPAPMADIDESCALVNNLFGYDQTEEVSVLNEPKLYVSSKCKNLIYCLNTWTGADGQKGASKDPIDALRYLVLMDPIHVHRQAEYSSEGGSY